jgi:CPA1 family monovalent cation:H+ antiporter
VETFIRTEILVIELLLITALVGIAVRRLRIPYTVALVVAGLFLTLRQPFQLNLTPELFLVVFLPPLVFEAALHINLASLRRDLLPIALLAGPGVVLTMLIVSGVLTLAGSVSLPLALIFGALISATDPVSIVALFRQLGVPRRLGILMESESLLNDGTAIVLFNLVLGVVLAHHPIDGLGAIGDFVRISAGGILVGLGLGWVVSLLISRVDDHLIETTLTTVLAYGAYLVADRLGFSGVLAVVAAGLINGNLGTHGMSPTTRIVVFNFWEYIAFLANSLVFLVIGLQVNISSLLAAWQPILWAILGVLVARVVVVYGLGTLSNLFSRRSDRIPASWHQVLTWGGLRGGIALALALSLPEALGADRELLQAMTFGVVLFTLLVQGTTMGLLVRRLGLTRRSETQAAYELQQARLTSMRSATQHLDRLHREGLVPTSIWESLKPELDERTQSISEELREVVRSSPGLEAEELDTARREFLRAQRSALQGLLRQGVIAEDVYDELAAEVDFFLSQTPEELQEPGVFPAGPSPRRREKPGIQPENPGEVSHDDAPRG